MIKIYTDNRNWKYKIGEMLDGGFRGMYQKPNQNRWHSMRLPIRKTFDLAQSDLDNYAKTHKFIEVSS